MIIKNPSTAIPTVTLTNTTAAPSQPNYSINPMYGSGSGGGWRCKLGIWQWSVCLVSFGQWWWFQC